MLIPYSKADLNAPATHATKAFNHVPKGEKLGQFISLRAQLRLLVGRFSPSFGCLAHPKVQLHTSVNSSDSVNQRTTNRGRKKQVQVSNQPTSRHNFLTPLVMFDLK